MYKASPRGRIYGNITETIGATPLVRFARLEAEFGITAENTAEVAKALVR